MRAFSFFLCCQVFLTLREGLDMIRKARLFVIGGGYERTEIDSSEGA